MLAVPPPLRPHPRPRPTHSVPDLNSIPSPIPFPPLHPTPPQHLTAFLNNTLRTLIECILDYDGDIVKFAGDAMLIVWKIDKADSERGYTLDQRQAILTAKAVACATSSIDLLRPAKDSNTSALNGGVPPQRQSMLGMMRANMSPVPQDRKTASPSPSKLQIHVGVGVGEMAGIHVGGLRQRWEYIVMGECANSMMRAESIGKVNQVVACPKTKELLDRNKDFLALSGFSYSEGENGEVTTTASTQKL